MKFENDFPSLADLVAARQLPISGATIAETAYWCERKNRVFNWCEGQTIELSHRHSLTHPFRSKELQPDNFNERKLSAIDWQVAVESVLSKRQCLVETSGNAERSRLLCFEPYQSLSDGSSMMASSGYFDCNNIPPWDTWVGGQFGKHEVKIFSLVPHLFSKQVEEGISVNPEGCIYWIDRV